MEIISLKMNNITKVDNIFPMFNIPKAGKNKLRITSSIQAGKSNNLYEVLSLCYEKNVGINDIKRAYRCMALQYHPDVCHDHSNKQESTRRFIELQKAYETLSDPILRENYDYQLSLRDSKGTFGRKSAENSRIVHKDVWERQLNGLRRRSLHRMENKRSN
ncbi:chaperone protein dnaJ 20, chloroplastic-like [Lycium barbarum]|uniref:chaperone protein dnaJ 20, chloroplastic-like n=1 Tax=Lycium ferocissimum TaxID=112874 RepID=UPI0028168DD3|nr:chaperone protein dnaJ 20, chloroplastic-like [Lycium ferocissimum]XP_060182936.1 chaperone protein dnaJ 20, chloroplastic-like [Lycium barbarum]